MPRFAANLSMLFADRPLLERFAAARAAGFAAVEIQFPYDVPLADLAAAKAKAGVEVGLINLPAGDTTKGDRGLGALPDRISEFRDGFGLARRYAERLGVKQLNLLAGCPGPKVEPAAARATLIENMYLAAQTFADLGITICVEAINTRDVPGFFVSHSATAVDLIDAAGAANLALQYDLYHMQIMEGDLIPTMIRLVDRIGHIQFADTPGRHQPGTGEINFANVFAAIDRIGYAGLVGAEYRPTGRTEDSLDWLQPWRR